MKPFKAVFLFASLLPASTGGLSARAAPDYTLTIIHVNDTHSRFEPSRTRLSVDFDERLKGMTVYAELGGFPQAADVINRLRAREPGAILVHAGDFFQGSVYFTRYEGEADVAFWNSVRPDIATFGNHEFDRGAAFLAKRLFGKTNFPFVSSSVDFSMEPALAAVAPAPWVIKTFGTRQIGFVGATTTDTRFISSPGKNIVFNEPAALVQKAADELARRGIDKIILVSHLGYDADKALAAQTAGIDVIIGGHSHTLLGDWKAVGLGAGGSYPTVVKDQAGNTVLVAQAWEWAKVVGNLKVDFDAGGRVVSWSGTPAAVVGDRWFRVYNLPGPGGEPKRVQFLRGADLEVMQYDGKQYVAAPADLKPLYLEYFAKMEAALAGNPAIAMTGGDPGAKALADGYAAGLREMQNKVVARVGEDMERGLNTGPGPVLADSMRAVTGAQLALTNAGGIRADLNQGPLTLAQLYEVVPFGDTLVTMKMKGADVVKAIEDGVDRSIHVYGRRFPANPLLYVSGVRFDVDTAQPSGSRLSNVQVLEEGNAYKALDPGGTYSVATNSFLAAGGDLHKTLKAAPEKSDTGQVDAEVLINFVKDKVLKNPEPRINIIQ